MGILNTFPFLRYSPSTDGVYCVYCVLFSNCTQSKKYHNLPEIDWSNVHQTSRNHSKSPEHNAGKKASDHTLCEEQAANFIAVFEGKILPVSYLLESQLIFVRTMIHQLETRLVQSEAHFKATELFPARIDFTLSNKQILQRLALYFEPNSP